MTCIRWPWDHREAIEHREKVRDRDPEVERLWLQAKQQQRENGLGKAVRAALSAGRKPNR